MKTKTLACALPLQKFDPHYFVHVLFTDWLGISTELCVGGVFLTSIGQLFFLETKGVKQLRSPYNHVWRACQPVNLTKCIVADKNSAHYAKSRHQTLVSHWLLHFASNFSRKARSERHVLCHQNAEHHYGFVGALRTLLGRAKVSVKCWVMIGLGVHMKVPPASFRSSTLPLLLSWCPV